LIAVGREHFLKYGFGDATTEQISEDAGFSRGALHSNFEDKEGLFLEVVREGHQRQCAFFSQLLGKHSGKKLLAALRETFADRLVDPDFRLMMEFQLEALRNDQLRLAYKGFHQEMVCDALKIIEDIRISSSQISFKMKPADVILAMLSYSQGIAIKQTLLSPLLSRRAVRAITLSVFDSLVSWRSEEQM
jgi:AcrR family transcriptional regulator